MAGVSDIQSCAVPAVDVRPIHLPVEVKRHGFTVLHESKATNADIIFVHGLGGDPKRTWLHSKPVKKAASSETNEASSSDTSRGGKYTFWPTDFLAQDFPETRILTWGYESNISLFFSGAVSHNDYHQHAMDLLYDLNSIRNGARNRPIIWLAHSLGGILVKEVLVRSHAHSTEDPILPLKEIYTATRAVMFFGTPHRGSSKATWGLLASRVASVMFDTNSTILKQIQVSSSDLQNLREQFGGLLKTKAFHVRSFQEGYGMLGMARLNGKVVDDESSTIDDSEPKRTIPADHRNMCRFADKSDIGYVRIKQEVESFLQVIVSVSRDMKKVIEERKRKEEKLRQDECLKTLWFDEMESRRKAIRSAHQKTCSWFTDRVLTSKPNSQISDINWLNLRYYDSYLEFVATRRNLDSIIHGTIGSGQSQQYFKWKNHGGLMWVKGKAGSGKSTLMKHTIQEAEALSKADKSSNTAVAGFFFNARGVMSEKSPESLFRALLWQIFDQVRTLFPNIMPEYEKRMETQTRVKWELEDLKRIFLSLKKSISNTHIFIFIDAFDEMNGTPGNMVYDVVKLLAQAAVPHDNPGTEEGSVISICFSSRPIQTVEQWWPADYPRFSMQEENTKDIQRYVQDILKPYKGLNPSIDLTLYSNKIIEKADGVFLWVRIVIEGLLEDLEGATADDLSERLRNVPSELSDVYQKMVMAMNPKKRPEILNMLRLVLFSAEPLRLNEFRVALATGVTQPPKSFEEMVSSGSFIRTDKQMEARLRNFSEGLLEVKQGHDIVQVIHQSVIDYFLEESGLQFLQEGCIETWLLEAHVYLMQTCINAIIMDANSGPITPSALTEPMHTRETSVTQVLTRFLPGTDDTSTQPYREEIFCTHYAVKYWTYHASLSSEKAQKSLAPLLLAQNFKYFKFWRKAKRALNIISINFVENASDIPIHDATLLYIAAEYNLQGLVEILITRYNISPNTLGGTFCTALGVSVYMGWQDVTNVLLQNHASISHIGGFYGFPLQAAAWASASDVVLQMLSLGANVNENGGYYGTALEAAAAGGDIQTVLVLLNHGADSNLVGGVYGTALQAAVQSGKLDIVKVILKHTNLDKPDVVASMSGENSLVSLATKGGFLDILGFILRKLNSRISAEEISKAIDIANEQEELMAAGILEMYTVEMDDDEKVVEERLLKAAKEDMVDLLIFLVNYYPKKKWRLGIMRAYEIAIEYKRIEVVEFLRDVIAF